MDTSILTSKIELKGRSFCGDACCDQELAFLQTAVEKGQTVGDFLRDDTVPAFYRLWVALRPDVLAEKMFPVMVAIAEMVIPFWGTLHDGQNDTLLRALESARSSMGTKEAIEELNSEINKLYPEHYSFSQLLRAILVVRGVVCCVSNAYFNCETAYSAASVAAYHERIGEGEALNRVMEIVLAVLDNAIEIPLKYEHGQEFLNEAKYLWGNSPLPNGYRIVGSHWDGKEVRAVLKNDSDRLLLGRDGKLSLPANRKESGE